MPATQSKGDFYEFRDTLAKLERLVDLRDGLLDSARAKATIGEAIIYTLDRLAETDVNTSISYAIMKLERLAMLKWKVEEQRTSFPHAKDDLKGGQIFDKMIDSKIEFIRNTSFNRLHDIGECLEPMNALKLLVKVQRNLASGPLDVLLDVKIKEVVYTLKVKPPTTIYCFSRPEVAAASDSASQKQENSKRNLPNECEESNTTVKTVSSPPSWLQDQDNVHAKDDDSSTIDGGELTPTSTIVSDLPDPNGG